MLRLVTSRGIIQSVHLKSKLSTVGGFKMGAFDGLARSIFTMPSGAWDSHVHVVNEEAYPFDQDHPFRPKKADLDELLSFEKKIGVDHVALVAISVYGNDNSLLLERLRELKGRGRGVVSLDPATISEADLHAMHSIGVRGVRINLKSRLKTLDKEAMISMLKAYANVIRPWKWSLHLHVGLLEIGKIHEVIPQLGVDVVLDHMATPDSTVEPRAQEGYQELMELLKNRCIYMKLSGLYRFSGMPGMNEYITEVLRIAPTQVIWASDWPHTGGAKKNPGEDRTKLQEYRTVNIPAFIEECLSWCGGDEGLMHKILVDNPRRLWQYDE